MTDRYAVIGHPVEHSLSPQIHAAFAAERGENMQYGKLYADVAAFETTCGDFFAAGGAGLNVTLPFKERAFQWVAEQGDGSDESASRAKAVNTLVPTTAGIRGSNTDGVGLLQDLRINHSVVVTGSRILVLGAGGAVRGILGPLLDANPYSLLVANRTVARAESLAAEFDGVKASSLLDVHGAFDVVINATSAELGGPSAGSPDGLVALETVVDAFCYDLYYRIDGLTNFCAWATQHGARVVHDGLGMLVEQAAEAFLLWRGYRPQTSAVVQNLRRAGPVG